MGKRALLLSIIAAGVAGAAAFGWVTIRRGFSARDNPSVVETYVAKTARRLSVSASERNAKNPFAPTPEVLSEARAHFADHCAICHGNDGSGQTMIGGGLYPKPPDLRQPETQNLTDGELFWIIENGVRFTGMPAFSTGGEHGGMQGSWKLVHFIRHLPHLTAAERIEMERYNPKGLDERAEEQQENDFLNGATPQRKTESQDHR